MKRRVGLFLSITFIVWAVLGYPARLLWGDSALAFSAVAMCLCLVPTALTLLWTDWAFKQAPEQQVLGVLGGTGVRLFFVLSCGLALNRLVPYFEPQRFWIWILFFYLLTLSLEMLLLLSEWSARNSS